MDKVEQLERAAARDQETIAELKTSLATEPKTRSELVELSVRAARAGDFACTVCRERRRLAPFEQRADAHGNVFDLWICLNCHAILNGTQLSLIQSGTEFMDLQANSSDEFYAVNDDYLRAVPQAIDDYGLVDFLIEQYPEQPRGVFLDFGAGRGILSGAAAKHFERVYAAELSLSVLRKVREAMPRKERIIVTDDYKSIPCGFDAIGAMHTLEHLPNLREVLDDLTRRLNDGGSLFFQVPLLRNDYLVIEHYTFFTEVSARFLCWNLGLETVGVWFDHALDFLTCIARKPQRPSQ